MGKSHPHALTGRVGDWRAYGRVQWLIQGFRRGPQSGSPGNVSNPRLIKPGLRFSRTGLSWMLRAKGYGTYQAESAFGCGWGGAGWYDYGRGQLKKIKFNMKLPIGLFRGVSTHRKRQTSLQLTPIT